MPIFTAPKCFTGLPFQAIDPSLAEALANHIPKKRRNPILLRLECYLQVTQQSLNRDDLSRNSGQKIISGFISALYSTRFHQHSQPGWFALFLIKALREIGVEHASFLKFPTSMNISSWKGDFLANVRTFENAKLDIEKIEFWRGWAVTNADGKLHHLVLWPVYLRHGAHITKILFDAARTHFMGGRDCRVPILNQFARYLYDYPKLLDIQNSIHLGELLTDFFVHYFKTAHSQGFNLETSSRRWRSFCNFLEQQLLGKAWANPLPALPRPAEKKTLGSRTNIRKTAAGHEVKQALVTEIPLHISDSEAKELLFHQIQRDVDILLKWARSEISDAQARLKRRKKLAPKGIVSVVGMVSQPTGLRYRLSRDNPEHLAHAAATFEARCFDHLDDGKPTYLIYPKPGNQTAWELGIPTHTLLLAHSTVLIASHPIITTSFLEKLNLFDKDGKQTGLIQTDAGWYLVGEKPRKGADKAEQRFLLNAETLQVVLNVIELTQPLRDYLRAHGKDVWRRLFLATSGIGVTPSIWRPSQTASSEIGWLTERLQELTEINATEAEHLARNFSLKRLRSSAAVLVYLETGSVEQMAKALGHERWSASLLDHYLPRPIQEFFVERWIRIFQTGIICEALKNSSYLLEASNFQSMDELDSFLENHALRRIPAHLEDPDALDKPIDDQPHAQMVFGIELGTLTLLISLQHAVATSKQEPCGRAIMWARISERLVMHLEAQTEQPEFHDIVTEAKRCADASKVDTLIYG